jgi:hypothetical protein
MRTLIITYFFLTLVFNSTAQSKTDTLIIGHKKYALRKSNIYHPVQYGPVSLPSEYDKIQNFNKGIMVNYKASSDTTVVIEDMDDGSQVMIKKTNSYRLENGGYFNMYSFLDTIKLTLNEFCKIKPYIKSNNAKINFLASKVNYLYKDTLGEIEYRYLSDGDMFSFWNSCFSLSDLEKNKLKQTVFIVHDLYYVRKNATYYLDREFIIVIK